MLKVVKLVVIQPTPFCNIDCRYYYLPYRTSTKKMGLKTLEKIFSFLFSSPFVLNEVSVVWHAGEPMVLPISFYRQAFNLAECLKRADLKVKNSFQTNGTLITQEWCDFISESGLKIGVSIDGPQFIHDRNRRDRFNRGTFEKVRRGIELLVENRIPFGVIAVLTDFSLDYPEEIFNFFLESGAEEIGFNTEEVEGVNRISSLGSEEAVGRYASFLKRIIVAREHNGKKIKIREVDRTISHILRGDLPLKSTENKSGAILNFDCDGNVSTFSPELLTVNHPRFGNFSFGNIRSMASLKEMFKGEKFLAVNAEIQKGVSLCKEQCDYFALCGGGAPSNKLSENGAFDTTETLTCRLRVKATTDIVLNYLEGRFNIET
ncbi:MAG: cyclophane-forming radical SAM/SPASM peptide maturase GrrM/OscB [Patescibacteria group bacterium]